MFFAAWKPATDVFNDGSRWLIRMELAGVSPAELQVAARGNELSVRGRRRDLLLQPGYVCHVLEINYSSFERSVEFPAPIVPGSIQWECRDGILRIFLQTQTYQ